MAEDEVREAGETSPPLPEGFRTELGQHLTWGGSREPSKEVTAVSGAGGQWLDLGGG